MLKFTHNGWFFKWKILFCTETSVSVQLSFIALILYFKLQRRQHGVGHKYLIDRYHLNGFLVYQYLQYLLLVLWSAWTGGEDKKFDEIITTEKKNYLYKIACPNNNKVSRVVRVVVRWWNQGRPGISMFISSHVHICFNNTLSRISYRNIYTYCYVGHYHWND